MAREGQNLDGVAEDLQSAAKALLDNGGHAGDSSKSAYIKNVAHIVLDKGNRAADSSKVYLEKVVKKVHEFAQNSATSASGSASGLHDNISRALHVGAYPGSTTAEAGAASTGTDGGFFSSIVNWCTTLCGSKNAAAEPRSIDFPAAAENLAQVLRSSTSSLHTSSHYAVTPAESLPESPAYPKADN